jgi:hypothetical protein
MRSRILLVSCLIILVVFLGGCGERSSTPDPTPSEGETETSESESASTDEAPAPKPEPVHAVCIYDGLYFRNGPSARETAVYRLKKGEIVTWMGEAVTDQKDDRNWEFFRIRLTDGSDGWALSYYIVPEAIPAAVISRASIYSKNNLISKTEESLEPMDIIAVLAEQDEWLKVVNDDKSREFWIKPGHISKAEVDIAVANQAMAAMAAESDQDRFEKLKAVADEDAFTDSIFIPLIESEMQEIQDRLNDQSGETES